MHLHIFECVVINIWVLLYELLVHNFSLRKSAVWKSTCGILTSVNFQLSVISLYWLENTPLFKSWAAVTKVRPNAAGSRES